MRFGSNLYIFFVALIAICVVVVMLYEPAHTLPRSASSEQNLSSIELDEFVYHELSVSGVLVSANGSKGYRFGDEDIIYDLNLSRFLDERAITENLASKTSIKRGEILYFPSGAMYERSDDSRFWSDGGEYSMGSRTFVGHGRFWSERFKDRAEGENIRYKSNQGILEAEHIRLKLEMGAK
ncbi:MAG: hypothetical protein ACTTJS_03170 [Wolinella sp.]